MLERLTPIERAVFLLADVFDEPFSDIAAIVGKSPAACRQIASRARRRVRDPVRHVDAGSPAGPDVAAAFVQATVAGDIDTLLGLLAPDVVLVSDGGAERHAARRPVRGAERVARFLMNIARRFPTDVQLTTPTVNGEPGIVLSFAGRPFLAMALEIHEGRVHALRSVVNPRKLRSRHVRMISPTTTISATSTAITTVTTVAVELRRRLGSSENGCSTSSRCSWRSHCSSAGVPTLGR